MGELFKSIGKFFLGVLKQVDWKDAAYQGMKKLVLPKVKELSLKTESKIDDVMYSGLEKAVETFLAPKVAVEPKAIAA